MSDKVVRRRRSSDQVRTDIMEAATVEFGQHGFSGTTARAIARRARVAEPMVYRHFGNKQNLYDLAVANPLRHFAESFAARWLDRADASAQEVLFDFVEDLYDAVRAHRAAFIALSGRDLLTTAIQAAFTPIESMSQAIMERHHLRWDLEVGTRAAVMMVVVMATADDSIFSPHPRPDRDRIVRELWAMLIGATGLPRPDDAMSEALFGSDARDTRRPIDSR